MNEKKTLPELIQELMTARGLNVDKLAASSNIPPRFIAALVEGKYKELPSKPYIRGYLMKLAPLLEVEPEVLLKSYDSEETVTSGKEDKLPVNRFAIKPVNRGLIAGIIILVIIVGFIIFRFNDIIGKPEIQVNIPSTTDSENLNVTGEVTPGDSVSLNGQEIYPASDGTFEQEILLNPGLNTLQFTVKRFLGRSTTLTEQVFYETTSTSEGTTTQTQ